MDDIANHIVKALSNVKKIHRPRNSICDRDEDGSPMPWADGIELQNQILNVSSVECTINILGTYFIFNLIFTLLF